MSAPPSWDALVEASCVGQAQGFELGWNRGFVAGFRAGQEDAQDARTRALVVRGAVEGIEAVRARQRAAQRTGEHPARWSA